MCDALGWSLDAVAVDVHAAGASLAFAAAQDRLYSATEVNEWAWHGVAHDITGPPLPNAPGHPAAWDFDSALATLRKFAADEAQPAAMALLAAAANRGLPAFHDEDGLSIGAGQGSQTWLPAESPVSPEAVPWARLHDIPTALVTGSNGKTTTVRLVSAMCNASGLDAGFNCTDGIFITGQEVERGDYSGPSGARQVLRDRRVQAAILETARGGILRRGLAVRRADAAIVTNISADHFGEYGVHDLTRLTDAKLVVARAIGSDGVLVLNADDALLREKAPSLHCPLAWFSLDDEHPQLVAHRQHGGATCGVAGGQLQLTVQDVRQALGQVDLMPLSMSGSAYYNVSNIAGAALLAACLGVGTEAIASVLSGFGADRLDNPGRLECWQVNGASVLIDYAHNPEGLAGLMRVARRLGETGGGRIGLLLGQAGNRDLHAIRQLAQTAAAARPDLVILKDLEGYMRGRAPGEVPEILRQALLQEGVPSTAVRTLLDEVEAARAMLAWARSGDVVVLPVHNLEARAVLVDWLNAQAAVSAKLA